MARQTSRKVGKSLTEVPPGSGVEEGAQHLLAECLRCSLSRDAPRQSKGAHTRSSETHTRCPRKPHPHQAFGRRQAGLRAGITLKMASVGHLTRRKLRTTIVSRLFPQGTGRDFSGDSDQPKRKLGFPQMTY